MPRTRLAFDTAAYDHLRRSDRRMGALVERVGPPTLTLERLGDPYAALVRSIVYQQLTGKAAATILGRVCALHGSEAVPSPAQVLATRDARLRAAGLSTAKTAALKDLARRAHAGEIPSYRSLVRMTDDAIVERLTEVRGIGRWSVEMMLIFRMGRPDVWPVGDYAVRKSYAALHGLDELPSVRALEQLGEPYRPFRSAAAWYLWRALDTATPGS
ncbi:MAG: DNA-3-methyladenine glycosylase 2 family protein [Myxococcales bacterium]|nr:DNA-3-methyladenine glycosylase 2 family protein [Myxococcales bacterium]